MKVTFLRVLGHAFFNQRLKNRALAQTLYEEGDQVTNAWALYETSLRDFHTDPALDPYMKASFPICLSLGLVSNTSF